VLVALRDNLASGHEEICTLEWKNSRSVLPYLADRGCVRVSV
jgi:hypothetical protein